MKKRGDKKSQEKNRKEVIRLLRLKDERFTQEQVASMLGITRNAVGKIWRIHRKTPIKKIISKRRGLKDGLKLKKPQIAEMLHFLKNKKEGSLNNDGIWTLATVQALILRKHQIDLSRSQVMRCLRRWQCCPLAEKIAHHKEAAIKPCKGKTALFFICKSRLPYFGPPKGINFFTDPRPDSCLSAINGKGELFFKTIKGSINAETVEIFIFQIKKMSKTKPRFIIEKGLKSKQLISWGLNSKIMLMFAGDQMNFKPENEDFFVPDSYDDETPKQMAIKRSSAEKKYVTEQDVDSLYENIYKHERPKMQKKKGDIAEKKEERKREG